jgi:hypothetical protein
VTWLYVPGTSSVSALAQAGLASASSLPNPERFASLTWRGKPRQPQLWLRAWRKNALIQRLSGLTLEHSTLDHGVASWIASLAATRANQTASPERASGPQTTGSSLTRSSASCASAGLVVCSGRTSSGTRQDSLRPLSLHWKGWATALRQEYSARRKWERATGESGFSSWPTAKVTTGDYSYSRGDHSKPVLNLEGAAKQWTTPVATDTNRTTKYAQGGTALSMQATAWPSPTARMHKGGGDAVTREDGKSRLDMLDWAAEAWSPSTAPAPAIPDGLTYSHNAPTSRPQLNARFAEWLMGMPHEWTSSGPSETEFTRWQLLMRGELLTLCLRKPPQTLL